MLKNRFLILVPAFFLIVILFASMPLNFAHKIGEGCPLKQHKPILKCNPCLFHSITSQSETDNLTMVGLPTTPFVSQTLSLLSGETVDSIVIIVLHPFSEPPPLRC